MILCVCIETKLTLLFFLL